jgi:hypothetical protein
MFAAFKYLLVLVVTLLSCAATVAQQKSESLEQSAKSFVDLLNKKEFAKAATSFDAEMLKAMPAEELKNTWEKLLGQAGAFKSQLGARSEKSGEHEIVYVTCEFAKAKIDVRVVFDKDGKIGGLFFGPAKEPAPAGVEEIWEGTLKFGPTELPLVFHLFKQKDGSYIGTMDSPKQSATGIKLDEVAVKSERIKLELKSADVVFEGKIDKGGTKITGSFQQSGQLHPLILKRKTDAKKSTP